MASHSAGRGQLWLDTTVATWLVRVNVCACVHGNWQVCVFACVITHGIWEHGKLCVLSVQTRTITYAAQVCASARARACMSTYVEQQQGKMGVSLSIRTESFETME